MGMTVRQISKAIGKSDSAVRSAAKDGRISSLADGTFDLETVKREWSLNTDPRKARPRKGRNAEPSRQDVIDNIQRSRMVKAHWEAREQRVRAEEAEGLVLKKADVEKSVFEVYRSTRDRFLAVPDRLGPVIAGIADIPLAIKTLRDEILIILEELSGGAYPK